MKNFNISKSLLILSSLLSLFSCSFNPNQKTIIGKGEIATKSINLASFSDIELSNYCDIKIVNGPEFKVKFSDYKNIIHLLEFKVIGNKLMVQSAKNNISVNNSKAKATIYIPEKLNGLVISGSGSILIKNRFDNIQIAEINGSGDIKSSVFSTSNKLAVAINGSGEIDFSQVETQNINCEINGSGDIKVNAIKSLKVDVNGSGSVYYKGNPKVSKEINGSGDVAKI